MWLICKYVLAYDQQTDKIWGKERCDLMNGEGTRIRQLREAKDLSLGQLAYLTEHIGLKIDKATLWRIEQGKRRPSLDQFVVIAKALDTTPVDLLAAGGYLQSKDLENEAVFKAIRRMSLAEILSIHYGMEEELARKVAYDEDINIKMRTRYYREQSQHSDSSIKSSVSDED